MSLGQRRERCHVLLFDDYFVGKMMHHETLCLTGGGITQRDIVYGNVVETDMDMGR